MTPEDFAKRMQEIADSDPGDAEGPHQDADDLLCSVLTELGYEKGVEIFQKMPKWYA